MSNVIVNGNSGFTKIRNLATANLQFVQADSIVATDLRLGVVSDTNADIITESAGNMGDIKIFVPSTADPPTTGAIYVCCKSGDAGVAVWLSATLN